MRAEARLLTEPGRIDGNDYGRLVPLAKALRADECPRGETVVYRALLKRILDRAYALAYGHAARYWARLGEISGSGVGLLLIDAEGRIRAWNRRLEEIYGLPRDEALGRLLREVFPLHTIRRIERELDAFGDG